jgi:hypothetical protein
LVIIQFHSKLHGPYNIKLLMKWPWLQSPTWTDEGQAAVQQQDLNVLKIVGLMKNLMNISKEK